MGKRKHGSSPRNRRTLTYLRWSAMLRRCENPKQANYPLYGGRGIKVHRQWHDFETFLRDMGECPKGLTLEREDGSKGYEPGNCRWGTMKEQQRNRSTNNVIAFNGETRCLVEWAERIGLQPKTLRARIYDHGWSIEAALTTPLRGLPAQLRHSASDSPSPKVT